MNLKEISSSLINSLMECSINDLTSDLVVMDVFSHLSGRDIERVHKVSRSLREMIKDTVGGKWLFSQHWDHKKVRHDNGQLKEEWSTLDGKLEGTYKTWYRHGQLREERAYKDGKLEGLVKWWHRNGQLGIESFYEDGRKEGTYKGWYNNGQLEEKYTSKNGKVEGTRETWWSNGRPSLRGR